MSLSLGSILVLFMKWLGGQYSICGRSSAGMSAWGLDMDILRFLVDFHSHCR